MRNTSTFGNKYTRSYDTYLMGMDSSVTNGYVPSCLRYLSTFAIISGPVTDDMATNDWSSVTGSAAPTLEHVEGVLWHKILDENIGR